MTQSSIVMPAHQFGSWGQALLGSSTLLESAWDSLSLCFCPPPTPEVHALRIKFFFKILFIHERHKQREAPYGEPNVGLNPRTPGSPPEPKVGTQPLSHSGAPNK